MEGRGIFQGAKDAFKKLSAKISNNSDIKIDDSGMPKAFECPISKMCMEDPVTTVDGFCYERVEIKKWFDLGRNTNPINNASLADTTLQPCSEIRNIITEYRRVLALDNKASEELKNDPTYKAMLSKLKR